MKKAAKFAMLIFMACAVLTGCRGSVSPEPSSPGCRVVTQVSITYENGPIQAQRFYTNTEKMQCVLNYLRLIDPYGRPEEDPESVGGNHYRITLSYSDGCEKTYLQRGDRFLKEEGKDWKKIDPTKAEELGMLMGQMESDEQV